MRAAGARGPTERRGAQDRLLVRNWSGKVVIILGRDRRPLFRLDKAGVFQFDGNGWWEPAA